MSQKAFSGIWESDQPFPWEASCGPWFDLEDFCPQRPFRNLRIVGGLGTQPVAVGKSEKAAQTQVGIRTNDTISLHNRANALRRHTNLLCQKILADSQWSQEYSGLRLGLFHLCIARSINGWDCPMKEATHRRQPYHDQDLRDDAMRFWVSF